MHVLVTGGAGYVGSLTTRQLLEEGHRVRVLDCLRYGGRSLLPLYQSDGFEFVRGDIRSREDVDAALEGVDAVVHLAAIVGDPACAREVELAKAVNQEASLQLVDLVRARGVDRLVFASTCSNYGRMLDPSRYVDEDAELRPLSVYAETKVAVERALLDPARRDGIASTVLRFATVYGLSGRPRFDLTVNDFAAQLLLRRKLVIFGAQFWRPYIHVRDAARAVTLVLSSERGEVEGRVFNVGSTPENYQKGQIVGLVREQLDGEVEVESVHRDDDPRDYRVSFERIQRELGFAVTRTVPDGIREVLDALRQGVITDFEDPAFRN